VNRLSALKNRGRVLAGGLLLAMVTTAALTAPPATAAPVSPAAPSGAGHPAAVEHPGAQTPPGGITWSAVGATPKGANGRYQFVYPNIKPGTVIKDWVELFNRGNGQAAFLTYGADATGTTLQSSLIYLEVGKKSRDIGSWVSFYASRTQPTAAQGSFVMPGGNGIIEPFTITVPRNATPGDHTGGLMVQVSVPQTNAKGQQVIVYSRIALPILMRVIGPLHAGLQVQSVSTGFNNSINPFGSSSASISYSVTNTGNVRMSGTQVLKVAGVFGMSATINPLHLPTILPGDSVRISATAAGLYPAGPFTATVTVKPAWPRSSVPVQNLALTTTTSSASFFAVPWSLLGFILLLAGAGFGALRFLRWRSRVRAADMAAVADQVRKETERRLLGSAKTTAGTPSSASASSGDPAEGQGEAE
jgi:hypothetical protein